MKKIYIIRKTKMACLALAVIGLTAGVAQAQYVIGSFQGASDPNNAGWVNAKTGSAITADSYSSFAAGVVAPYAYSLDETVIGNFGVFGWPTLQYQLQGSPGIAAFKANSYVTLTFSCPDDVGATNGWYQLYNFYVNSGDTGGWLNMGNGNSASTTWAVYAQETGATGGNSNNRPGFYMYSGAGVQTQVVTFNYSSFLPTILGANNGGWGIQIGWQGNTGNSSGPQEMDMYLNNVELSSGPFGTPEPATMGLLGAGIALTGLLIRRRNA